MKLINQVPDYRRRASFRVALLLTVLFVFAGVWCFSTPWRMMAKARWAAVRYQPELLREAQAMLDDTATSRGEYLQFGFPSDPPMPPTMKKLGGHRASVGPRYPGAVKVDVTAGFTHYGLYIIPDPTTVTETMLDHSKVVRIVNEHILEFDAER